MTRRASALAGSLLAAAVLLPAQDASASEPSHVPVSIETNFEDEDPDRTKRVQPVLEKSVVDALEHRHHVAVSDNATTKMVFVVRNLEEDPKAKRKLAVMDYGVLIEVRIDGEKKGDKVVFCTDKGEAELVDCAIEGIPEILQYVPVQESGDGPEPNDPPPPQPPDKTGPKPDRVAPIGPWGIVGIVVATGGLATTIAGAVDLARGEQVEPGVGFQEVNDYRPRGRILLGTGIGLLVVGTVALAVDVGIRAKKRKRQSKTSHFQIELQPGGATAGFRGRF